MPLATSNDMVTHMKTTLEISDPVLRAAKAAAAREGTTVRALVEEGLRKLLAERKQRTSFKLRRVSFRGNGLQEPAQAAGWEGIRDMIYEGRGS
jgi:Bacterial antitoxin of type II TA system, VapB